MAHRVPLIAWEATSGRQGKLVGGREAGTAQGTGLERRNNNTTSSINHIVIIPTLISTIVD